MQKNLQILTLLAVLGFALPASADFLALQVDGQLGYTQLKNIAVPNSSTTQDLTGPMAGIKGKLEILLINVVFDWQHFLDKYVDTLHLGLGFDLALPLGVVEPWVRASGGLMMLSAKKDAFSPSATDDQAPTVGGEIRVGAGLDIPLMKFLVLGASGHVGYHYITGEWGLNWSILGSLGVHF